MRLRYFIKFITLPLAKRRNIRSARFYCFTFTKTLFCFVFTLCVCLSVSVCVYLCLSVFIYVCLCLSVAVCVCLCLYALVCSLSRLIHRRSLCNKCTNNAVSLFILLKNLNYIIISSDGQMDRQTDKQTDGNTSLKSCEIASKKQWHSGP